MARTCDGNGGTLTQVCADCVRLLPWQSTCKGTISTSAPTCMGGRVACKSGPCTSMAMTTMRAATTLTPACIGYARTASGSYASLDSIGGCAAVMGGRGHLTGRRIDKGRQAWTTRDNRDNCCIDRRTSTCRFALRTGCKAPLVRQFGHLG